MNAPSNNLSASFVGSLLEPYGGPLEHHVAMLLADAICHWALSPLHPSDFGTTIAMPCCLIDLF